MGHLQPSYHRLIANGWHMQYLRDEMQLESDLRDDGQGPLRADQQSRDVVAGGRLPSPIAYAMRPYMYHINEWDQL